VHGISSEPLTPLVLMNEGMRASLWAAAQQLERSYPKNALLSNERLFLKQESKERERENRAPGG
jgi:hypothetical protein